MKWHLGMIKWNVTLVFGALIASCGVDAPLAGKGDASSVGLAVDGGANPAVVDLDQGTLAGPTELSHSVRGATPFAEVKSEEFSEFENLRQFYLEHYPAAKSATAAVAIMGGFSSCRPGPFGMGLFKRALAMLKRKAAQGQFFRFVATCFAQTSGTVYYYTSSDLHTLKWAPVTEIAEVVRKEASETSISGLYIIGHSWGGWLTFKTLLALPQDIAVHGLASIDPISPLYCNIRVMVNAYLRSVFSFRPDPGCTQPPNDIDQTMRSDMHERAGWWHNFYQDNSGFLRSGAMPPAINHYIKYDYSAVWQIFNGHRHIETDERVWSRFEQDVVTEY